MNPPKAIDETASALLFLEQQLRHAREAAMPLTQERVSALAYQLGTIIEHLAEVAPSLPDNDHDARSAASTVMLKDAIAQHGLLTRHEELSGGRDRRLVVVSFATRWFVLAGFTKAPLRTYGVHGPYDHHEDATREAVAMHRRATQQGRSFLQVVRS